MANPTIGLTPLTLTTPTLPQGVTTLSVDSSVLPLTILADQNTLYVDVLAGANTVTLTRPTPLDGQHVFSGTIALVASPTSQVLQFSGRNYDPLNGADPNASTPLLTPTAQYDLLFQQSNLATSIAPPTGVTIHRGQSSCRIEWATPAPSGFLGVRVEWSTDPSGVSSSYAPFGDLVTDVDRSAQFPVGSTATTTSLTATSVAGQSVELVTSSTQVAEVEFSSATIPATLVHADLFYVLLTTVLQDPVTNRIYESRAAGPFSCGFVNLKKTNPTDFLALQKSTDIASRMISEVTRREAQLDLTARSEVRDLIINPLSLVLADMSVRAWFSLVSQSISAIAQIDDADGDGVSDTLTGSPYKGQIARAYGLNPTDCQAYIDKRFDILGEGAGLARGGSTTSVVMCTFFVYTLPPSTISIPLGTLVSTVADGSGQAVQFRTTATGLIDPSNPSLFYDATNGWYACQVPAQCTQAGSLGQVGANTIRQVVSGASSGVSVINLLGANGGSDQQSNADYAAMIQDVQEVGIDNGSRNGYAKAARSIPGITDAFVVASGDLDMVRDWSSLIQRHTYGCVDVYTRGNSTSEQTEQLPFSYASTSSYGSYPTYLACQLLDLSTMRFKISGFSSLPYALYTAVELVAQSAGRTLWLGTRNAQFDNVNGVVVLDPNEIVYQIQADGTTSPWQISGVDATNLVFLRALGTVSSATFSLMGRYQSGFSHVPALQPVFSVTSLSGADSGTLDPAEVKLSYTSDFLLTGGSNQAGDTVWVSPEFTVGTTQTVLLASVPQVIDKHMALQIDPSGSPGNVLSVRSLDASALYIFGTDYTITASGPYRSYSISPLPGGALAAGQRVLVAYNRYRLNEEVVFRTETVTLSSSTPASLSYGGFIHNTWLPRSWNQTALLYDQDLLNAGVGADTRYIKLAYTSGAHTTIGIEGRDFQLSINPVTGFATVARVIGGAIPEGVSVSLSYYTNEVLSLVTEYPTYVQQAINTISATQHACADVLVKAMVANPVDITLVITPEASVPPDAIDAPARTAIGITLDNASTTLAMSVLVAQVQRIPGVRSVQLPLVKCAKANGSYVIAEVITTGTTWLPLANDPSFATISLPSGVFITAQPVLSNSTIPSGGTPNAYVGLLYEGQPFTRANSVTDFLQATGPSFYIFGAGDQIDPALLLNSTYAGKVLLRPPAGVSNPGLYPYRVTYQAFDQGGATDISVASGEYLTAGVVTLLYASGS